jgi:hypothetical protein
VIAGDPNVASVGLVAAALGELCDDLVLVGGCAASLLIAAPVFLATKFEAFRTRGQSDVLLSHDFEDIINVVEGRVDIVQEVGASEEGLRAYLGSQFARVTAATDFHNVLQGLLALDDLHAQRLERVQRRISALAVVGQP